MGEHNQSGRESGDPPRASEVSRRDFVAMAAGVSLAATGLLAVATAAQAIVPPSRSIDGKTKMPPTALVAVDALEEGKPQMFEYGDDNVWITKLRGGKIVALDAACPHVQCKLPWDEKTQQYACPCHASFFRIDGTKISGPALRNMDPAIFVVQGGKVVVSGFVKPA